MAATTFLAGYPVHGFTQDLPPGRIVVIILEGGMDGLAAVPPIGDPNLKKQRRNLIASSPLSMNPFFALHPSLKNYAGLLANNEATIIHSTAFPYTLRSHFEGQNIVQGGLKTPFSTTTGWLGRAMDEIGVTGRAMSLDSPLLIRGAVDYDNFYPASISGVSAPKAGLLMSLAEAHNGDFADTFLKLNKNAIAAEDILRLRDPAGLALAAGKAMRKADGPRVTVIKVEEFDTHANQGAAEGDQAEVLEIVDQVMANLKSGLKSEWKNTIVLTVTEFGRTVKENGSAGTDHGYGSVGLLAGGLLNKSNVISNWPGLKNSELFEGRDLYSTLDYRSVCAACIEAAFGLDHTLIAEKIFEEPKLFHSYNHIFG